ncbi:MAG: efflux RND transporter periplasmic adaptor subunit [Holophagales bacterium]|nr:efflux RND transporter periplasmic adaptor subunit [Holophagales bacterium]
MRRWALRFAVLLGLVGLVIVLRATVLAPEPIPVTVAEVSRGPVEETVTNTRAGTVEARYRAELSPEVGGLVVEIPHREGERVTAGDLLLRLEPRLAEAEARLAESDLRTAHARLEEACSAARRAEREHGRLARLASDQIVSEDVLDQAATAAETTAAGCVAARAAEKRAESAVRLAEVRLEQLVLRAPFDGVIAEVSAEVGEWITPSPPAVPVPPVIDILDPSSTYISAPMDEVDSAVLRPGLSARITVDSMPGQQLPGVVARVAPYVEDVEEQNRTVEIEARFDDPEKAERILPGTSADVEVFLQVRPNVVRIPTSALVEGGSVFSIESGRLVERPVEIGLSNWDWTEILSGLEPGEVVVTSLDRVGVEAGAEVIAE